MPFKNIKMFKHSKLLATVQRNYDKPAVRCPHYFQLAGDIKGLPLGGRLLRATLLLLDPSSPKPFIR
jgi:hypothetical protein